MQKKLVRIVALLLVAMLALTLIPLGALADESGSATAGGAIAVGTESFVNEYVFDEKNPTFSTPPYWYLGGSAVKPGSKLEVDDYEELIGINGDPYEFEGFANAEKLLKKQREWFEDHPNPTPEEIAQFQKELLKYSKKTEISFKKSDLKIPQIPTDPEDFQEWLEKYSFILAGYVPHTHKLSRWYSDSTTHWRECLVCKHYDEFDEDFMYQNWHIDGDEDRVCDVCYADIPYHEVRVIESEGGTITVNETEAPHRRKIIATVEAAEGYTFKKLHFTKVRDDGSRQEITRYKNADGYWTYMPTYDLEVSAEFVKK